MGSYARCKETKNVQESRYWCDEQITLYTDKLTDWEKKSTDRFMIG